jgi:hypothetical protein
VPVSAVDEGERLLVGVRVAQNGRTAGGARGHVVDDGLEHGEHEPALRLTDCAPALAEKLGRQH